MTPDRKWRLKPTDARHHGQTGFPYVIALHPSVANEARGDLHLTAVVRQLDGPHGALTVLARVLADSTCSRNDLRMDQTLRTALGLPALLADDQGAETLAVFPVHVRWSDRVRDRASAIFGRRYVLWRTAPPDPDDIEKRICRVPADDLVALGTREGGRVVLFAANREDGRYSLRRVSLQALALDGEAITQRRANEKGSWAARYRNAPTLLDIEGPDLSPIWFDRDIRQELGIEQVWPVLARRDVRSSVARETQEFGVALLASVLAMDVFLEPILASGGLSPVQRGTAVFVVALLASIALMIVRLRADLR